MILREIRSYLSNNKEATLNEIAADLKTNKSVIEMAINHWIKKGKVKKNNLMQSCKGCTSSCGSCLSFYDTTTYKWIE